MRLDDPTERILAELEAARADVAALAGDVSGVVRLGAFPTAASVFVPAAIAACRAGHPDLKVVLEEWETPEGITALKAGYIDVLLLYEYNLLPAVADTGIELTPLVTESLLAAVPATLPLGSLGRNATSWRRSTVRESIGHGSSWK